MEHLKEHRTHQVERRLQVGAEWQDHDLVFCNAYGSFLNPSHIGPDLRKLLKKAKLPQIRFHDLRHTAATLLLSMKVNPKMVQEMLGHSDIGMTLGTYSHVLPTMHEEAVQKMDQLFGNGDEDEEDEGGTATLAKNPR